VNDAERLCHDPPMRRIRGTAQYEEDAQGAQMNAPKITFFMLVTNRDALIADYAVKSYKKVHDEFKDELPFVLYIYCNCVKEDIKQSICLSPHSPDDALSNGALHADSDIGISTLFWIERGGDGKPGG